MTDLFKKIYMATLIEAGLLAVLLYVIPAEAGGNLILGRSAYRWILILPALLLTMGGLLSLIFLSHKHRLEAIVETLQAPVIFQKQKFADFLVFYNLLYLIFLFISFLLLQRQAVSTIVRLIPWFVFAVLVLIQINYFFYRAAHEAGIPIDLKRSLLQLPFTFRSLVLENKGPAPSSSESKLIVWLHAICMMLLLFAFFVVEYYTIVFAQLNSDEGWYLNAARQVYLGQRLYQDFAFTQMPLVPYVYGWGLFVWKSMYAGRLISLLIFCASLVLLYRISKRNFRVEAFFWLLLLLIVYADGIYFNTVVKTYALTFFFFVLSYSIWGSRARVEIKYPALFIVLILGCLTRITFAFYAIVLGFIALVEIWRLKNRLAVYRITVASCLPFALWAIWFLYPDPVLPIWNVYQYNATLHEMDFSASALSEFVSHFRGFLRYARPFLYLGIPLAFALVAQVYYGRSHQNITRPLALASLAGFSFISLHFFGGGPMLEYYVPGVMFLVVLAVWFLFSFTGIRSGLSALILWTARVTMSFIVISMMTKVKFGIANYNLYEGHPPIRTVQQIANVVNRYYPNHPLFTLEALYVAIETDREIFPGLEMAQFSILDMSTEEVRKFHMLNPDLVEETLVSAETKIVILSKLEMDSLAQSIQGFDKILEANYTNVFEIDHFGQKAVKAYVFIRK